MRRNGVEIGPGVAARSVFAGRCDIAREDDLGQAGCQLGVTRRAGYCNYFYMIEGNPFKPEFRESLAD
jgi:hypothetical protein